MRGQLAVIRFIDASGRPIDPGFGVGGGGNPDQGFNPDYPDNSLPPGLRPIDPGFGVGGRPIDPGFGNRPPWDSERFPPGPTDPNWGVDAPGNPGIAPPIYIPDVGIDNSLPPVAGHKPLPDPPPGYIWPPLPPSAPAGKTALLVWLVGVGWRYMVVTIPPPTIDNTVPGAGEGEAQPKGRFR